MICARCGSEVPTKHAHKYGLNGYRCEPTAQAKPEAPKQSRRRLVEGETGEPDA